MRLVIASLLMLGLFGLRGEWHLALANHPSSAALFGITDCCPNKFVRIDLLTGALTPLGDVGTSGQSFASAAAVDPANHRFFTLRSSGGATHVLVIDT